MRTVEIPGGTAQLRDRREEMRIRQQRVIDAAAPAALPAFRKVQAERARWQEADDGSVFLPSLTRQEFKALNEFQNAQIVALLRSWTLDLPLPDEDTIEDLHADLYGALRTAVIEIQNTTDVFLRENMEPSPEEESPTDGSDDSEPDSKASKSAKSKATAKS